MRARHTLAAAALSAAAIVACGADPAGDGPDAETSLDDIRGDFPVGAPLVTTDALNQRRAPSPSAEILQVIPPGTTVYSASNRSRANWYGVTWNGATGWVSGRYLKAPPGSSVGGEVSALAKKQMREVVAYADRHHSGASTGRCFEYVWRYLTSSTYGRLTDWNDARDMPSAYARNFAEYMNVKANADLWDLQRLPIDNPYDAPVGAVVVVAPGSPGTSHPTAGDIAIAAGGGRFINDGPNMSYGPRAAFKASGGRVLGVFVPK